MIASLLFAGLLLAPTPSPTLSPLPTKIVNWYAERGADASGLDPSLIRSVIDNESAGDPHAVSNAGAVGMMQLEPETLHDCGYSDAKNALHNVICGSKTLSYLVRDFGLKKGIAAYNWGAGNVQAHPLESAWPQETKNYVASVVAEYDALQHHPLVAVAPTPSPTPIPAYTPLFARIGRINFAGIFGRRDDPCPDRGVKPFLVGAQVTDSIVTANAIRHGAVGVRFFGSASPIGFILETAITDIIFHRLTRHSCVLRTAGDLLLTGSAINNATNAGFPK